MALLSTQVCTQAGITPTYAAATAGGDAFVPTDTGVLIVKNGGGAPVTVTLDVAQATTPSGDPFPEHAVTVANGSERWIGPLSASIYRNASTGQCAVTYSAVTSVTVAVVAL
jgi:hypothetical protein